MITVGMTAAVLIAVTVLFCRDCYLRRKRSAERNKRRQLEKEREDRREAHYMRNFWNYDGSVQEEFEE